MLFFDRRVLFFSAIFSSKERIDATTIKRECLIFFPNIFLPTFTGFNMSFTQTPSDQLIHQIFFPSLVFPSSIFHLQSLYLINLFTEFFFLPPYFRFIFINMAILQSYQRHLKILLVNCDTAMYRMDMLSVLILLDFRNGLAKRVGIYS